MNPFMLLVKPMIAAGLFVTKMLVAVGYVVTQGHDPAAQQAAAVDQVRLQVVPSDAGLESMELEMPNGELFQLTSAAQVAPDSRQSPNSTPARPNRSRDAAGPQVSAMLESTLGRTMRCDVSLPHDSERGSARCIVREGETYDLTF